MYQTLSVSLKETVKSRRSLSNLKHRHVKREPLTRSSEHQIPRFSRAAESYPNHVTHQYYSDAGQMLGSISTKITKSTEQPSLVLSREKLGISLDLERTKNQTLQRVQMISKASRS